MRITALLIACAPALMAFECNEYVPGTTVPLTEATDPWRAAVHAVAEDWRSEPSLPSIDGPRCREALGEIEIRVATEREWIDRWGLCPMMPSGCSTQPECGGVRGCVTGTVAETRSRWRVYLTPGESADGHAITVRHEVAHILHACSVGNYDVHHTNNLVWRGANSVVWRDYGQSSARVACGLGGS